MNCLYTIGRWKIFARPTADDGSVQFLVEMEGCNPSYYVSGYIRDSWFKRSIRTAWNMAIKDANNRHKLDSESEAGMAIAIDIADNFLSNDQVENLLESVLAPSSNGKDARLSIS